jgi:protocatechuate 3,4-dioxygenase alpha subunit
LSGARVPTPSQTVGPFFGFALPFEGGPDAASTGNLVRIEGRLLDGAGDPVPDGLIELWDAEQFGRCGTDTEGAFHFTVLKPSGDPYINVMVFARGLLRHLVTRMYFPEMTNAGDSVLERVDPSRRHTLIAQADGAVLRFDIRLQGESETVFFDV